MGKNYNVIISRVAYQSHMFSVYASSKGEAELVAGQECDKFDWSEVPTSDYDFDVDSVEEVRPERQVTIIFGEMIFEEEEDDHLFCTIETEQMRVQASISKAEEFAENIISEGLYISYVIPELYDGTIK